MQLWSLPEVLSLRQSRQGDSQPDLAEAVLKLSAAYARCMSILQPSSSQAAAILPNMIAAASACAGCCHKKTGSSALNMLIAVLTGAGPLALLLQQVVAQHGALIAFGAFSALLVPSPLPRLQKVSSVLLELAAFAARVEHSSTAAAQRGSHAGGVNGFAAALASGSTNRQRGAEQSGLYSWLSQATQGFVPAALSAQEAADLAAACAGLLCSSATRQADADSASCAAGGLRARQVPASRSFAAARRLKKRLRDFAEKHMRKSHSAVAH